MQCASGLLNPDGNFLLEIESGGDPARRSRWRLQQGVRKRSLPRGRRWRSRRNQRTDLSMQTRQELLDRAKPMNRPVAMKQRLLRLPCRSKATGQVRCTSSAKPQPDILCMGSDLKRRFDRRAFNGLLAGSRASRQWLGATSGLGLASSLSASSDIPGESKIQLQYIIPNQSTWLMYTSMGILQSFRDCLAGATT